MDDGMQNPWLKKDITLAVFDGAVGLGNGRILPAGPLRQSLKSALPSMDMAVINGSDKTGLKQRLPQKFTCLSPRLLPNPETADEIKQRSLLAFAGIGRPQGFFDTLEACGAVLVKTLTFADHHPYSEADLTRLYLEATQLGAELITTQKDWVRLPPEWRERIFVLDVSLMLDDDDAEQLMQTLAPYLHKEKG
jgi:tetraacyldisaccharide 4'-kinase